MTGATAGRAGSLERQTQRPPEEGQGGNGYEDDYDDEEDGEQKEEQDEVRRGGGGEGGLCHFQCSDKEEDEGTVTVGDGKREGRALAAQERAEGGASTFGCGAAGGPGDR